MLFEEIAAIAACLDYGTEKRERQSSDLNCSCQKVERLWFTTVTEGVQYFLLEEICKREKESTLVESSLRTLWEVVFLLD